MEHVSPYRQFSRLTNLGLTFLAGQGALENGKPVAGGIREHTKHAVLVNGGSILARMGLGLSNIVYALVCIADIKTNMAEFDATWIEIFGSTFPPRFFIGGEPPNGSLVEIMFIISEGGVEWGEEGVPEPFTGDREVGHIVTEGQD